MIIKIIKNNLKIIIKVNFKFLFLSHTGHTASAH